MKLLLAVAIAFVLLGCTSAGTPRSAPLVDAQTPSPSPSPHVFSAQGGAVSGEDRYRSFRQWASQYDQVAIARVVAMGPAQWNTKDGRLPPGLDFLDPVPGNGNALRILRPIQLELVRAMRGDWPKDFYTLRWGGQVGNDVEETKPDPLPLAGGQLVIVFGMKEPLDIGATFPLTVLSDFPVDGSNRILTPTADRTAPINPDETLPPADPPGGITLDNIGQYLDLLPRPPGPG